MFMPQKLSITSQSAVNPSVRTRVEVPIRGGLATLITFRGLSDDKEHMAICFGDWEKNPSPLVRVHSECLTGDVFGSAKCDCGEQLDQAITDLRQANGIILYLRQEGRGIGLYNKLDAYRLQQLGMDTYEANRALGFSDDHRDYTVATQMLQALGVAKIRLLSNNPDKVEQLRQSGIFVEAIEPTKVFVKRENRAYLGAKITKTRHLIRLPQEEEES